jgi:hypothetical protein
MHVSKPLYVLPYVKSRTDKSVHRQQQKPSMWREEHVGEDMKDRLCRIYQARLPSPTNLPSPPEVFAVPPASVTQ